MMYIYTVLLGYPEETFWECTPKKLDSLYEIYKRNNGIEEENKSGFIDDVL